MFKHKEKVQILAYTYDLTQYRASIFKSITDKTSIFLNYDPG